MKDPERTEAAKEPAFIETLNKLRRDKLSSMPKPDESAYGSRRRVLEDSLFRPPSQKPRAFDLKKTIMAAEKAVVLDNSNRERRRDEDASGLGGRGGAESLKRLRSSGSGVGSAGGGGHSRYAELRTTLRCRFHDVERRGLTQDG